MCEFSGNTQYKYLDKHFFEYTVNIGYSHILYLSKNLEYKQYVLIITTGCNHYWL